MKQKNIEIVINSIPILLSFLIPFFFLPITVEFFEFNKLYLVAFATLIMLILWAIKMLVTKDVSIVRSKMDLPIILLVSAVVISSIFSVNRISSIYGATGRWFPTLVSYLVLAAFYYVSSANITSEKTIKRILSALVAGSTITVLVGLLLYFDTGIIKSQFLAQLNFSLTGARLSLAVVSAIITGLSIALIGATDNMPQKALLTGAALTNIFSAVVFGNTATLLLLAISVICALGFNAKSLGQKVNFPFYGVLGAFTVLTVLLLSIQSTRTILTNAKYPMEAQLNFSEAWRTSISSLRDFPVTGSGPSTYYLNYTRYKSPVQNNTNTWNVKFDRPNNEILNVVATMGLVGIAAFALFTVAVVKFALKNQNELANTIAVLQISVVASLFFTYGTVLTGYLLFLSLALQAATLSLVGSNKAQKVSLSISSAAKSFSLLGASENAEKKEVFHYVIAALLMLSSLTMTYFLSRYYLGEYYMRKALTAASQNNGNATYANLGKAIRFNPKKDSYHTFLARTSVALANSLEEKKNLSDQDKQTIQRLILQAVQSSRLATEVLNPLNSDNWQTRAFVYGTLRNATKDAFGLEVQSYNTAIRLDPTNPALRVSAGGPYYAKEDYLAAGNLFAQAVNLKGDYANARYNLAYSLLKLKAYERARQEFAAVQKLITKEAPDYEKIAQEIANLDKLIAEAKAKTKSDVAGASDAKLSVEDLEGQTPQASPQEPLTLPTTNEPNIESDNLDGNIVKESTEAENN
jgi:O-antigen ligase